MQCCAESAVHTCACTCTHTHTHTHTHTSRARTHTTHTRTIVYEAAAGCALGGRPGFSCGSVTHQTACSSAAPLLGPPLAGPTRSILSGTPNSSWARPWGSGCKQAGSEKARRNLDYAQRKPLGRRNCKQRLPSHITGAHILHLEWHAKQLLGQGLGSDCKQRSCAASCAGAFHTTPHHTTPHSHHTIPHHNCPHTPHLEGRSKQPLIVHAMCVCVCAQ